MKISLNKILQYYAKSTSMSIQQNKSFKAFCWSKNFLNISKSLVLFKISFISSERFLNVKED